MPNKLDESVKFYLSHPHSVHIFWDNVGNKVNMKILHTNFRKLKLANNLSSVIRLREFANLNLTAIDNFHKVKTMNGDRTLFVNF